MKFPSSWSSKEVEVADMYGDTLSSLKVNSKPIINTLTELANDYSKEHPHIIVHSIEERIKEVSPDLKLTTLYLLDSIVKNHPQPYKLLFSENIVRTFAHVFRHSNEKFRAALFKLRTTWNDVFSPGVLLELDQNINKLDPAWPIIKPKLPSTPVVAVQQPTKIHINPAVFGRTSTSSLPESKLLEDEIKRKEVELMEAKKRKLEMELMEVKRSIEEQEKAQKAKEVASAIQHQQQQLQDIKPKIHVNTQRVRDPRVQEKLPKEIADMLESTKKSPKHESALKSRSSALGSPKRDASVTKTPPSPGQPESPSSTSNLLEEDKKKEAPPPPTIRDEMKPSSKSSSSKKSSERSRHVGSGNGSSKTTSSSSSSSSRKRGHDSSSSKSSRHLDKSDKSPVRKSYKEEVSPGSKEKKRTSSSSPSPPPAIMKKSSSSGRKPINQRKFRIPKKNRTPSPNTFEEEGPHVEFNSGKRPIGGVGIKKRKEMLVKRNPLGEKKLKLNEELFGEDSPKAPSLGWAKFKEVNPDEYRTPIAAAQMDMGGPQGGAFHQRQINGPWQSGPMVDRSNIRPHSNMDPRIAQKHMSARPGFGPRGGGGMPPRFSAAGGGPGFDKPNFGAMPDGLGQMIQQLGSTDPSVVLNIVIPDIVRKAQENLDSGRFDKVQFSTLVKHVMQLKEQALMLLADKMHGPRHPGGQPGLHHQHQQQGPGPAMAPVKGVMGPPAANLFLGSRQPQPDVNQSGVNRDLPLARKEDLEMIAADPVTTIDIDMLPRDIRYYGEMATIIMAPGDVRELSFSAEGMDPMRRVIIDDNITLHLPIGSPRYTTFTLNDGIEHGIKIGAPTRELWVDGQWYQCYFNEFVEILIGSTYHKFFLVGPPPTVNIGKVPLRQYCLGTVQLIINGDINAPATIYLDAKPQRVDIAGKPHVLQFVQGLQTLLINGHPFRPLFGGTPMVVYVNQQRHYLRLTTLPEGVRPDRVRLLQQKQLEVGHPKGGSSPTHVGHGGPASPPMMSGESSQDGTPDISVKTSGFESRAFDRLLSMMPSPVVPKNNQASKLASKRYSSSSLPGVEATSPVTTPGEAKSAMETEEEKPAAESALDIQNLWSQLLGAGLVKGGSGGIPGLDVATPASTSTATTSTPSTAVSKDVKLEETAQQSIASDAAKAAMVKPAAEKPQEEIKPVVLKSHDPSIKLRQKSIINTLYNPSALQCKNCGLRYSPSDMIAYSQHLDWHFRMKRREKENARKAQSRAWFFDRYDWINSDEIDDEEKVFVDEEEKAKEEVKEEIPVVLVNSNDSSAVKTCPVCNEEFEEFYTEEIHSEKDDGGHWYYRNAVVSDGRNYHPQCLQDKTLNESYDLASTISEDEAASKSEAETSHNDTNLDQVKSEPMEEEESAGTGVEVSAVEAKISSPKEEIIEDIVDIKQELAEAEPQPETEEMETSQPEVDETREPETDATPETEVAAVKEANMEADDKTTSENPTEEAVIKMEVDLNSGVTPSEDEAVADAVVETPSGEAEDKEAEPEEVQESEIKEETQQDKTNDSSMDKSLDGNAVSDAAPAFIVPSKIAGAGIRINLTSQIDAGSQAKGQSLERRESVISNSSDNAENPVENSDFDEDGVVQPPKYEDREPKAKLKGRKLMEMPPQMKGVDTSSLCSIM